jgi:hypothetical protein
MHLVNEDLYLRAMTKSMLLDDHELQWSRSMEWSSKGFRQW